jgi:hypothetical protein
MGSVAAALGLLFFEQEKKIFSVYIELALKRAIVTVGGGGAPKPGAPQKKRLLPTARWIALVMSSVAAAARLLFFEQEKSFSVCMQREALDGGGRD